LTGAGDAPADPRFAAMASLDDKVSALEDAIDAIHNHPTPDITSSDQAELLMKLQMERDLCASRRSAIAQGAAFSDPGPDAAKALIDAIEALDAITAQTGALEGLGEAIVGLLNAFPAASTLAQ
jgi:hypothetical protein